MDDNYAVRISSVDSSDNPLFNVFARMALQAWETKGMKKDSMMVQDMKRRVQQANENKRVKELGSAMDFGMGAFAQPGVEFGGSSMGGVEHGGGMDGLNEFDWTAIDWDLMS
jgi:hypothetical protein